MPIIRTIAFRYRHEAAKIKGSRFFATLDRATTSEEAMAFVHNLRAEFPDATHHCFAWRLDSTDQGFRYSDDGEPSGTAGRPILQEIQGRNLEQTVLVVTRYYGGTKLGTGGLLRAYSSTAAQALDRATLDEYPVVSSFAITFSYNLSGAVQGVLSAFSLKPIHSEYGEETKHHLAVPIEKIDSLQQHLREACAGRVVISPI